MPKGSEESGCVHLTLIPLWYEAYVAHLRRSLRCFINLFHYINQWLGSQQTQSLLWFHCVFLSKAFAGFVPHLLYLKYRDNCSSSISQRLLRPNESIWSSVLDSILCVLPAFEGLAPWDEDIGFFWHTQITIIIIIITTAL